MKAYKKGDTIALSFEKNQATIKKVRAINGREWHPKSLYWTVPLTTLNLKRVGGLGFDLSDNLKAWYTQNPDPPPLRYDLKGLKGTLRPYQEKGVKFLCEKAGRGFIGDEMGLGKTPTAVAFTYAAGQTPTVVVCPASVKIHWQREFHKWTDLKAEIVSGQKCYDIDKNTDIIILNYAILPYWIDYIVDTFKPQTAIIDEAHYCKNPKANRTQAVGLLSKRVDSFVCLSGTPITNKPIEFFTTLNFIKPDLFPDYWDYIVRYCGATYFNGHWDTKGSSHVPEMHKLLSSTVFLRRKKKDVLKELPPKVRTVIPLEVDLKEYNKVNENFKYWLMEQDSAKAAKAVNAEALVKMEVLKQLAVGAKLDTCIEWITDYIRNGEKLVVFCTHTKIVEILHKHFNKCSVMLYGKTRNRQEVIDQFAQDPDTTLFIGNLDAAGTGTDGLQAASATCTIELGWVPAAHLQAEDRVHRIGQKADSVNAYYLIASGTIEEDLCALLDDKIDVLSRVLDGEAVDEETLLTTLMRKYGV